MSNSEYMARAIQLAEKPEFSPHPNPRVGCVIVNNNHIVGEGYHEYAGGPHAEVNALSQAGDLANGAIAFVSLEPCCFHGRTPPCVDALIKAKVKKVFIAMLDPNPKVMGKGVSLLERAGIEVESGLLAEQAKDLNKGFIQRMTKGRPWVRCKIAMSFDGRTAMANGESQWISGQAARLDVQRYRAKSDAILTGVGTVLADNPRMTVRGIEAENIVKQPLRVIVDSQLKVKPDLNIFHEPGNVLVATLTDQEGTYKENVNIEKFPENDSGVDLSLLLEFLAKQEINEVQVEAGAKLNGALLREELIDEIVIYMANSIMGDSARGLFSLPGLTSMDNKIELNCLDFRKVGENFRFTMQPVY